MTATSAPAPLASLPYAPSWLDRFTVWVERLPVPSLLFYAGMWVVTAALLHIVNWAQGALPRGALDTRMVLVASWAPYCLAFMAYLEQTASVALATFHPALDVDAVAFDRLRYEFTTLPFWPALLANGLGVVMAVSSGFLPANSASFMTTPLTAVVNIGIASFGIAISIAAIYLTFRQLRLVRRAYHHATKLDLFQSSQVYAFSSLTLRMAIGWLVIIYSGVLAFPDLLEDRMWTTSSGLLMIATGGVFIYTLLQIQQRMRSEKVRHLDEIDRRLRTAFNDLHNRIDAKETADLQTLHQVMESLVLERGVIAKIPTWPWQPGTAASFLTAVLLPLIIWLLQTLIQRLTGL